MPQMAPLSWFLLFALFIFVLLLFNLMNYFIFSPNQNQAAESQKISYSSFSWKW